MRSLSATRMASFLACLLPFSACATDAPWPDDAARQAAADVGARAAGQLMGTLGTELAAAVDSAGASGAIDFCASAAPLLTRQAVPDLAGVEVKRTSERLRNPANAPDSLEKAALAWFAGELTTTGALPGEWIQVEGDEALRYYRPLVVQDLCVQCHGPLTALGPGVLEALSARYPDDAATGYLPGEMRGLVRVRIPRALVDGP